MLRLILMRHAESEWSRSGQKDHDRPLTMQGSHDLSQMANWLQAERLVPELILCSSALRTLETAEGLMKEWCGATTLSCTKQLYLADPETIQKTVRQDGCDSQSLMVIAHNPGLSYLSSILAGHTIQLSTSGLVLFEVAITDWGDFKVGDAVRMMGSMDPGAL